MEYENNQGDIQKVQRDMSQEYVIKLSKNIDVIDYLKMELDANPSYITILNERIHALFIKLIPKMTKKEVDKQKGLKREIDILRPIVYKWYNNHGDRLNSPLPIINRTDFRIYKEKLEEREIELNKVMERLELSNPSKSFMTYD